MLIFTHQREICTKSVHRINLRNTETSRVIVIESVFSEFGQVDVEGVNTPITLSPGKAESIKFAVYTELLGPAKMSLLFKLSDGRTLLYLVTITVSLIFLTFSGYPQQVWLRTNRSAGTICARRNRCRGD